ncbi:trimeric intracellular cation channel family protein [Herbaspirillum sp. CF444]|uniref:trimeric intracellular cation channel family protein n=1 Tax=Herbaspirillum sp. CF444 TaxID=1144319 RepID=UPI000555D88A|nr:trimeric intracellular cation channel family protein [Herbaspirillum sp. CF444]
MLLHYIYLVAITAEASSGAIAGMRREMDLFGLCLVGSITALGGGTVRDILLGHYPLGWVAHPQYLIFTIGAAIISSLAAQTVHRFNMVFLIVDALGLVTFTIIGCDIARTYEHMHPSIVIAFGMITGIFGGLLRDILCNEIPLVLRRELYASISLITGCIYLGLLQTNVDISISVLASISIGFLLRILAIYLHWELPKFQRF